MSPEPTFDEAAVTAWDSALRKGDLLAAHQAILRVRRKRTVKIDEWAGAMTSLLPHLDAANRATAERALADRAPSPDRATDTSTSREQFRFIELTMDERERYLDALTTQSSAPVHEHVAIYGVPASRKTAIREFMIKQVSVYENCSLLPVLDADLADEALHCGKDGKEEKELFVRMLVATGPLRLAQWAPRWTLAWYTPSQRAKLVAAMAAAPVGPARGR